MQSKDIIFDIHVGEYKDFLMERIFNKRNMIDRSSDFIYLRIRNVIEKKKLAKGIVLSSHHG